MKYLKSILIFCIIILTASCKKTYVFTNADLIGTWQEVSPCLHPNQCYTLQFGDNDVLIESSPYSFSSFYKLFTNNMLLLDDSVSYGPGARGSHTYQITGDVNNLTITKLYTPATTGVSVSYDLHLKKTN